MLLNEGYTGRKYVVEKINGSYYVQNKLKRMGIMKGNVIKLIRKHRFFSYIVELEGNRICFDASVAEKIEVIPYV